MALWSLKGPTTPATTFSLGSSFSIMQSLCKQTPKKVHKFQFSAHKGILNPLHTLRKFCLSNISAKTTVERERLLERERLFEEFMGWQGRWRCGRASCLSLKYKKKNLNYWLPPKLKCIALPWMCLLTVLLLFASSYSFSRHWVTILRGL